MTIETLFEEAKGFVGEKANEFWIEIRKSYENNTPYKGFSAEEITAYLRMKPQENTCACGNEMFNCICYSDAE